VIGFALLASGRQSGDSSDKFEEGVARVLRSVGTSSQETALPRQARTVLPRHGTRGTQALVATAVWGGL